MNTKSKQEEKNQRQKTRQKQGSKKQGNAIMIHGDLKQQEHEHPELRLTR